MKQTIEQLKKRIDVAAKRTPADLVIKNGKIVNVFTHEIDVSGRFIMNSDKLYELQAPYLTLKNAKRLLEPFLVRKRRK